MALSDSDILAEWGVRVKLAPAEVKALRWILLDRTRPFCSKDLVEEVGIKTIHGARNINWHLKKYDIIELYCKSNYSFYKLKAVNQAEMKKPVTSHRMGVTGLKQLKVDFVSLLESLPMEELCKVHDVRLVSNSEGLYEALLKSGIYQPNPISKDIFFGNFNWSKYRAVQVFLTQKGSVTLIVSCSNCPVEASTMGFVSMAGFLGGVITELLVRCRAFNAELKNGNLPLIEFWKLVMWHYGKDSAQEFSGEAFNVMFKTWCGELARIYTHEQDRVRKVRFEVIETPKKPLKEVIANKLDFCCARCLACTKQSL